MVLLLLVLLAPVVFSQWVHLPLNVDAGGTNAIRENVYWETNALAELVAAAYEIHEMTGVEMALTHTEYQETNLAVTITWYTQIVASGFTDTNYNGTYSGRYSCDADNPSDTNCDSCAFFSSTLEFYTQDGGSHFIFRDSISTGTYYMGDDIGWLCSYYESTNWVGTYVDVFDGTSVVGSTTSGGTDDLTYTNFFNVAVTVTNGVPKYPNWAWWSGLTLTWMPDPTDFVDATFTNFNEWFGTYSTSSVTYPSSFPRYQDMSDYMHSISSGLTYIYSTNAYGQTQGTNYFLLQSNTQSIVLREEQNHATLGERTLGSGAWPDNWLGLTHEFYTNGGASVHSTYIRSVPGSFPYGSETYTATLVGADFDGTPVTSHVAVSYLQTNTVTGTFASVSDIMVQSNGWYSTGDVLAVWLESHGDIEIYGYTLNQDHYYPSRHAYNQYYEILSGPLHYLDGSLDVVTNERQYVTALEYSDYENSNGLAYTYAALQAAVETIYDTKSILGSGGSGWGAGFHVGAEWNNATTNYWHLSGSGDFAADVRYYRFTRSFVFDPIGGTNAFLPDAEVWGQFEVEWDTNNLASDANVPGSVYYTTFYGEPNTGHTNDRVEYVEDMTVIAGTSTWSYGTIPSDISDWPPSGGGLGSNDEYTVFLRWRLNDPQILVDYSGVRQWGDTNAP